MKRLDGDYYRYYRRLQVEIVTSMTDALLGIFATLTYMYSHLVNGALANSEFFAAVFKCPSGSPMSHTKRCSIW
ncbi:hypothetical protein CDAR_22631 [Caerostris darwini]|uniref:Uncharacterized protein n=1 Tax=Caerostris darwini TaxID=1538125 RepID=A0AAV4V819_9ARAC|nr:hypothetical protein CDAR_22631 [Caerostris darwini]